MGAEILKQLGNLPDALLKCSKSGYYTSDQPFILNHQCIWVSYQCYKASMFGFLALMNKRKKQKLRISLLRVRKNKGINFLSCNEQK